MKKKEHIYQTAAKLFQKKGYLATSMRELAEAVQLEPSSLYSHIKSKEEILQKICFDGADAFTEGMQLIKGAATSPREKIEAIIELHVKVATEQTTSVTVFNDEWRHLSEPKLSEFLKLRKNYEREIKRIIQAGIDDGSFRDLDSTIILNTLLTSLRWIHYWFGKNRKISPDKIKNQLSDLLLNGLNK